MAVVYSALFIDYDNVLSSLSLGDSGLHKRFSTRPDRWLEALEITLPTYAAGERRRIISCRCYANPSTIQGQRPAFTQNGVEVVDCPPLTKSLKNGADIIMVMDVLDYVDRYPHIEEYIILSADADFTPLLARLRRQLKRTAIFASLTVAAALTKTSDQLITPDFFSRALAVAVPPDPAGPALVAAVIPPPPAPPSVTKSPPAPARRPPPAAAVTLDADLAQAIEDALHQAAVLHAGMTNFSSAAMVTREILRARLGAKWAGFPTFTRLLRSLTLARARINWESQIISIPDFSPEAPPAPPEADLPEPDLPEPDWGHPNLPEPDLPDPDWVVTVEEPFIEFPGCAARDEALSWRESGSGE